jgi:CelD/BcsL family acetyltransferase involved in cellulose biosynthesis
LDVKEAGSESSESDSEIETATTAKKEEAVVSEAKPKKKKKKRNDAKQRRFAETVGVEDNDNYPKFKDKERLVINLSNTKYFVIKFVAKHLFNFKVTYKN